MKDYKTLIADIRTEACVLADKLKRLEVFMMSEDFCKISPEQKGLLETQYDLMAKYKVTLVKRAHRINYEHAQNAGKEDVSEPEKKLKVPSAPPTFDTNPTLCETCIHPKGGYSTCHDCENGSNYSKKALENKCGNCKWYGKGHNGYACKDAPSDRVNMPCFEEVD
ncbi:MAG: hypothetical protein J6Q48_09840 [Bacteroidaceae bacterium]|nr:hypothetical protein [Bacteroidaceae bacterium]